METLENAYNGYLPDGIYEDASYDRYRLVCLEEPKPFTDFFGSLKHHLDCFEKSNSTRFDARVRLKTPICKNDLPALKEQLKTLNSNITVGTVLDVSFQNIEELSVFVNKPQRSPEDLFSFSKYMKTRVLTLSANKQKQGLFEDYALKKLETLNQKEFSIYRNDVCAKDLQTLWGENTFGWSLDSCKNLLKYLQTNETDDNLFVLKDNQQNLIAACLICGGETTEWAMKPEFQGKGLMSLLLIAANSYWVKNTVNKVLQVHARVGWSDNLWQKVGGSFPTVNDETHDSVLVNHVSISGSEADPWNKSGDENRSFFLGALNQGLFSPKIISGYNSIISELVT